MNPLDGKSGNGTKVLLRTWENKFDWFTFFFCIFSAVMQMCTYFAIVLCFRFAHMSGLNIGIAQSIWALNPFMVAVVERIVWGVGLRFFQVLGMIFLVLCTMLVSLSELFTDDGSEAAVVVVDGKTPTYVAVLVSLLMPIVCTAFANLIKYADVRLRLNALDWNCAFNGIMFLTFQVVGIVNFSTGAVEFDFKMWVCGSLASVLNVLGLVFAVSAFNSNGAPFGPIGALINMQAIVVCIVDAIASSNVPQVMQIVGMVLGILGALILTIPDEMYSVWHRLTRCSPVPTNPQDGGNDSDVQNKVKKHTIQTE